MELGAGVGLAGIFLAKLGAQVCPVLCEVIGEPNKRLAKLIGEPIKLTGKRALRKALGSTINPWSSA